MAGKSHKPLFDLIGESTRQARPGQIGATPGHAAGATPAGGSGSTSGAGAGAGAGAGGKPTIRLELKPNAAPVPAGSPGAGAGRSGDHANGPSHGAAEIEDTGGVAPMLAEMTPATSFDRRKTEARGRRITDQPASSGGGALWNRLNSMMGESTVILPRNAIYVALAAIIVVAVGIWLGGVKYGQNQESERWSNFSGESPTPPGGSGTGIVDPLANTPANAGQGASLPNGQGASMAGPSDGGIRAPELPQATPTTGNTPATTPPVASNVDPETPGAILASNGWTLADPRVGGLNYLNMATLSPEEAERAVPFFKQNGVEVFGVPIMVDRRAKSSKNAGPAGSGSGGERKVVLYAAMGVTPDLLKTTVCQNLETKIAALGQSWLREYRGSTNFGRPLWMKYTPAER